MSVLNESVFEVKWSIENVKSWFTVRDDTLYSPQFLAENLMNTRWKLSLSTNWHLGEKYVSLALHRDAEDNGPEFIVLNYELSFLMSEDSATISKSFSKKFASKTAGHELNIKGTEFLEDKQNPYVSENVLTVSCKLWAIWPSTSKRGQCSIRSVIGTKYTILNAEIGNFDLLEEQGTFHFVSPSSDISFISFKAVYRKGFDILFCERMEFECKRLSWYFCELVYLDTSGQEMSFSDSKNLSTLLNSQSPCIFTSSNNMTHYKFLTSLNKTLKLQLKIKYYPGVESEFVEYEKTLKNSDGESSEQENRSTFQSGNSNDVLRNNLETDSSDESECFGTDENFYFPSTSYKNDMTSLYNDRLFCDTKLQTETETFPTHKCVLSARSRVFKKMFTTDMKEAAGQCINVPDIRSDTVRRMLQFLYTDCVGDLDMQSAKDVYTVSDKYDIASLKHRCRLFMKENLSPANVCEILILADLHQDQELASAANEFVLNNDEEVFASDEWKLFMRLHAGLAAQVMYLKCTKK